MDFLKKQKRKKKIKKIPDAPKLKLDLLRKTFTKNPEVIDALEEYLMFKPIEILPKTKESEFRKGVCLTVTYKWKEVQVNLDKLKEYAEIMENFINFVKEYLASK